MEKIKLTNSRITLKDNKVSCECCGGCSYNCNMSIEFGYSFNRNFLDLPIPTLPPITSPDYYIGVDRRKPNVIGINLNDYPPEWGLYIEPQNWVINPSYRGGGNPGIVFTQGFQGSDYSLGRPDNCELCIYNPQTSLWDVIQFIDFTALWSGEVSRPNIIVSFQLLPKYIISEGTSCHILIKLQTPLDAIGSGSPMIWYESANVYESQSFPLPDIIVRTISDRTITNIMPASDIIGIDNITYNDNGYLIRTSVEAGFGNMLRTSSTNLPLVAPGFPRTDTIPGQNPSEVPWILRSNSYSVFSRQTSGTYKIVLESRVREKLFRPLSIIGNPNYKPNLIPIVKGIKSNRILGSTVADLYATNLGTQGDLAFNQQGISGPRNRNRYEQFPWYVTMCKDSPCNPDGLVLKTTPETTPDLNAPVNVIVSAQSDFGGTSKSGLPVFNDDGQLMCGPVPTVSHGPLLKTSTQYTTSDIDFFSGGTTTLTRQRLNNPISVGPGAIIVGPEARAQEVRGRKVLVFYAPSPEQETWGRGTNPEARTSRFLKFTTNWDHPDYDVCIEFSGSVNARNSPTANYSADPTIVIIPAGQTVAYSKCPFSPSDNFLQPIPPETLTGQTNGLVNGGWTIQFVQGPPSITQYIAGPIQTWTPNSIFSEDSHSISVEIMSYVP